MRVVPRLLSYGCRRFYQHWQHLNVEAVDLGGGEVKASEAISYQILLQGVFEPELLIPRTRTDDPPLALHV